MSTQERGQITYDSEYGHVCTCSRQRHKYGKPDSYRQTVKVDRNIEPTESGSCWYVCKRCGAGAWSGL